MSKQNISIMAAVMCLASFSAVAQRAVETDTSTVERQLNLDEVVVTGTRTLKRLSETPVLTTLIRERDIREAGSVSPLETLQDNIPGIVSSANAMGNNMRIRGLNSRYILFLVDGERLVSEGAGGNVNLDQIGISSVQRLEMINGAASALYGSNAVGAVINLITKEPMHKFELDAGQSFESYNTLRSRIDIGSALDKVNVRTGAFRNSSDGFGSDGSGAYAARYEDYGANLKTAYKISSLSDIKVNARYFGHETFNPAGSMNVRHSLTHNLTAGANGGIISADNRNSLRISVNYDKYFDYYVMEKKNNERDLRNTASYFSARALDAYKPTDLWEVVAGTEYNHEENFATTTLGATPTTKTLDDMNVFAQAEYKPIDRFSIVGGSRYTYNSQFGSAMTPKLSLMYDIAGFRLRGGAGYAFRAPSIKELYYDFDHQGMFWVYGNPDLKAEKGLYSSFSVEYTKNAFNASVSAYHNKISNKITQYDVINSLGANEKYYRNVSSATLRGIDANIAYTLLNELTMRASYSFCDARDNSTGLQLESNVRHSETVSATWNGKILKSPFSLQVAGRMHSPILYQQAVTAADGSQTNEYSESKPYSIWKVTLVKPVRYAKYTAEATLKVDNIFNFQETSFINPGRQFLAGIRLCIN